MRSTAGAWAIAVVVFVLTAIPLRAVRGGTERPGYLPEPTSIAFDSEWIGLSIEGDSLVVRGIFVFRCHGGGERSIPIFLPFPSDSLMGRGRMVSLSARSGAEPFAPARWEEVPTLPGARWWLPPCRGDSIVAEVMYRQKIEPGYASYIVRTIQSWGNPLRHAVFEIRLPEGATPIDFSFPFEPRAIDGETVYVYEVTDFFPDHDIVFRWIPAEARP